MFKLKDDFCKWEKLGKGGGRGSVISGWAGKKSITMLNYTSLCLKTDKFMISSSFFLSKIIIFVV